VQRPSLNRWIADVFWDYREVECRREEFIERYCARVCNDSDEASSGFDSLISAVESMLEKEISGDALNMERLRKALKGGGDLDNPLLNMPVEHLTVSTIHKAKGREFDRVYLLNSFNPKPDATDEARVWYVGATRPKRDMHAIKSLGKYFSRRTSTGRRVCTGIRFGCKYCTHIIVGFPGDISASSFVRGSLQNVFLLQQYISEKVHINDTVELVLRNGDYYEIMHNSRIIGCLSSIATRDFWEAINKTDNRANIPPFISGVYVSNIVTIAPYEFPSGIERMFKESGFWLGVELTGFGKVDWHYGGNQL
jgi:hypothetical protein